MFAVTSPNTSWKNVSQRSVCEIYFWWNMWHEICHHRTGIAIRYKHQHSPDTDEQRKRQYEWQALVRGRHFTQKAPPHRLSTSTTHKPTRQILVLTSMDKHIWLPGSTGSTVTAPISHLIFNVSISHSLTMPEMGKESNPAGEGAGGDSLQQEIKY